MNPSQKQREIQEHYGIVAEGAGSRPAPATELLYSQGELDGLPQLACSASRGCGDPLAQAELEPGEQVLDLGCGGGIDVLRAAPRVGESGYIYGMDMTPQMVELAARNAKAAQADNVSFIQGYIEDIPLPDAALDAVISNCVINLSDNKAAVLREAYRVLKPGGRFVVADIVVVDEGAELPAAMIAAAASLTGCVNGVLTEADYRTLMEQSGFIDISIEAYKHYTYERLAQKAADREQEELLALLDPAQIDKALAAAFIKGYKPRVSG